MQGGDDEGGEHSGSKQTGQLNAAISKDNANNPFDDLLQGATGGSSGAEETTDGYNPFADFLEGMVSLAASRALPRGECCAGPYYFPCGR